MASSKKVTSAEASPVSEETKDCPGVSIDVEETQEDANARFGKVVQRISDLKCADIMLYSGSFDRPVDDVVIDLMLSRKRKENLILILVTYGGDPSTAFRIAREAQRKYHKFSLFVGGPCKSAGTLVAVGANEIVMSDHGELGPIDIQLAKKDELGEFESAWIIMTALDSLRDKTFSAFENFFITTKSRSGGQISVPTASRIAIDLTAALISPISARLDPIRMGEVARAMNITARYGEMLIKIGKNIDRKGLFGLISGYPDHGFVIDREEAGTKFKVVREPDNDEQELFEILAGIVREPPHEPAQPIIQYLNEEIANENV